MAKNTTGLPNTGDYLLGRGIVYESGIVTATEKPDDGGWRDLGNCSDFTISLETETLEHQSSRKGLRVIDKEVILQQSMTIAFTLDEANDQNVSEFLSGETASHTNAAIAGFTSVEQSASVVLGRHYDLVDASGERAYDIDKSLLTLVESGTPTTLVEDTDYTVDENMGRVFLLSTASNISAGQAMEATLTADAGAAAVEEVRGLTEGNIIRAIKFIGENPANSNKKREWQFHKVTLRSTGDFALISDEYSGMGFEGTVESSELADSAAPYVRVRDHANS